MSITDQSESLVSKIIYILSLDLDETQEQNLFNLVNEKLEYVHDASYEDGEQGGYSNGYSEGYSEGHTEGFDKGTEVVCEDCYDNGWEEGREDLMRNSTRNPDEWL
jgi:flagellar biosynthesis/type III secretory pathway protein FliH